MNVRERIQNWFDQPGWRRHAPAVGSVVAHVAVAAVFAGTMAAVTAQDAPRAKPAKRMMIVELMQPPEELPRPEAGVTPPPRARPDATPEPSAPRLPADKRKTTAPSAASTDASPADDNTFYVPSSPDAATGVAKGLASLMGDDECAQRFGPKAKECAGRDLAKRTGKMDSVMARPKEQLAQYFGEFMPKCQWRVGCEGGEWKSSNGTRSVAKGAPGSGNDRDQPALMAGGAATLGGLNATTGRLGFNPDHTDPGFGD